MIDGLGHGAPAALAAEAATRFLLASDEVFDVEALMIGLGRVLRGTRGAAATLLARSGRRIRAVGVGNVSLRCIGASFPFTNTPGVVGGAMRKLRVAEIELARAARFVVHSDGVSSRFEVPELAPEAAVARIFEGHAQSHDDASLLVVDYAPSSGGRAHDQ